MSTSPNQSLTDFVALKHRLGLTHAIRAARELGVFAALAGGQRTAGQIAEAIQADPDRVAALMRVLQQSELIERYGDDYALSTLARLIPDACLDLGDIHWKHLVEHVRSGRPLAEIEEAPQDDQDFHVTQAAEEWMLTPAAMLAAQVLDIGQSRRDLNLLQLGCGSAVLGATFAHRDPESHLTLVDTEDELKRAQSTVDNVEIQSRTRLIAAQRWQDIEVIDFSGQADNGQETQWVPQPWFDMVLLSGHIHRMPADQLAPWLRKAGQLLLQTGGELVIVDWFPGLEQGDNYRALTELEFGLRHSHGRCHDPHELEEMLKDAGFPSVQFAHLPVEPYLYGLVLAGKG